MSLSIPKGPHHIPSSAHPPSSVNKKEHGKKNKSSHQTKVIGETKTKEKAQKDLTTVKAEKVEAGPQTSLYSAALNALSYYVPSSVSSYASYITNEFSLWGRTEEVATRALKTENVKAKIKLLETELNNLPQNAKSLNEGQRLATYQKLQSEMDEIAKNKAHLDLPEETSKDLRKAIKTLLSSARSIEKKAASEASGAELEKVLDAAKKTLVQIRKERHEKFASEGGIKTSEDAHKAFIQGDKKATAVKHWIRIGTEEIIKAGKVEPDPFARANKNLIQKGINLILDHYDDVTIKITNKLVSDQIPPGSSKPWIIIARKGTNEKVIISQKAWTETNLMGIEISNKRLKKYERIATGQGPVKFHYNPSSFDFSDREQQVFEEMKQRGQGETFKTDLKEAEERGMTNAHKLAINVYTGDGYGLINQAMQGNWLPQGDWNPLAIHGRPDLSAGDALKEGLAHAAIACNGLKKMNVYRGPGAQYLFRAEGLRYQKHVDQIKQQIDGAASQGAGYVKKHGGFTSSSYAAPSTAFYSEKKSTAGLLIKQGNGYLVTPYSQYKSDEREVLIPPTTMYYESYKEIKVGSNTITLFVVRPQLPS